MKKFEVIYHKILNEIRLGKRKPGDKIPSVRSMSAKNKVSKNTVLNAYQELLKQEWIVAKPKSGFYVSNNLFDKKAYGSLYNINDSYSEADLLEHQLVHQFIHQPGEGKYPSEYMEYLKLEKYLGDILFDKNSNFRHYGDPAGDIKLRESISRLLNNKNFNIQSDEILMSYGINHSLDMIIRCFIQKGDSVIVESPGYYPLFSKLKQHEVNILEIDRTITGIDCNKLESLMQRKKPKILFIQPYAHNPTGTDLSFENLVSIKKLCAKYKILVVESDPFLFVRSQPASYLFSDEYPSIYLSSFSKTVSPALRCGFIISSQDLLKSLRDIKIITVINTSLITENIMNHLIGSLKLENHLNTLKKISAQKSVSAISELQQIKGLHLYPHSKDGYFLWFRVPVNDKSLIDLANSKNIFIAPGSLFFPSNRSYSALRINKFYIDDTLKEFLSDEVFV